MTLKHGANKQQTLTQKHVRISPAKSVEQQVLRENPQNKDQMTFDSI